MTKMKNKELVNKFIDVVNKRNLAVLDELLAGDFILHGGSMGEIHGIEDFRRVNSEAGGAVAFPDFHITIQDMIVEGNKTVVRYTNAATNTGPFMSFPPTSKRVSWAAVAVYRIENGKIAEIWLTEDIFRLMQQLGVTQHYLSNRNRHTIPTQRKLTL